MSNYYQLAPDEARDAFVNDCDAGSGEGEPDPGPNHNYGMFCQCPECTGEPERKIVTLYVCPPIPFWSCDWLAYYDGLEESPHGWGKTEAEAIENLKDTTSLTE